MLLGQKDRKEKQDERRKKGKERRKRNEGLEEQSDKFLKAIGMLTKTYTEIIKI